ncbi:MAG: TIGR04552 family protein [Myxococcota bacterium]
MSRSGTFRREDDPRALVQATPLDKLAVRMLLAGGSVVDLHHVPFRDRDEIRRFMALNGFSVDNHMEMARLESLHRRAVAYVDATFDVDLPPRVRRPEDFTDLFLAAGGRSRWEQRAAGVVLKVMHVINHLEARRLIHHLSVSERALFEAAAREVDEVVQEMHRAGLGLIGYEPSTKSEHSLVTKLLSKPRVTAAQIFDKLRFRLVTRDRSDLVPVILWLAKHLFPFNHVVAGESHNTILDTADVSRALEHLSVDREDAAEVPERDPETPNPATSSSFRMINFVVDLPVRISRVRLQEDQAPYEHLGHLVLVTLELQLFDRATAKANEAGAGNHAAYKRRQVEVVRGRLWCGDEPPLRATED